MASTNTNDNTREMTLYERMGGDVTCELMTQSFFDEALEVPSIMHIFTNVPRNALKTHQIKLFRVIFGKEEERPSPEDFMDFMLRTHTRLFRDLGLDETHFDIIGKCLLNGMETFQLAPDVIEEVMTMLVPLRAMFEYGAKVAKQEREMSEEEKASLPRASMATIGTDQPVVLPVYSTVDIPDWLPQTLLKKKAAEPNAYAALSMENVVREWTCNLTNRFDADKKIADTFMDQPFMDHHVYLVFFLQLAFFPTEAPVAEKNHILNMVLYPRGPDEAPLSKELLDRMISEFTKACKDMGLADKLMESAVERL